MWKKSQFQYKTSFICSTHLSQGKKWTINALWHCMKSVCVFGPYFPSFGLNTERCYSVRMCENTDQKNSEYGHFSRSVVFLKVYVPNVYKKSQKIKAICQISCWLKTTTVTYYTYFTTILLRLNKVFLMLLRSK